MEKKTKFLIASIVFFLLSFIGSKIFISYNDNIIEGVKTSISQKKDKRELSNAKVKEEKITNYTSFNGEKIKKDQDVFRNYIETNVNFDNMNDLKITRDRVSENFSDMKTLNYFFPTKKFEESLFTEGMIKEGVSLKVKSIDETVLSITSGSYNYISTVVVNVKDKDYELLFRYEVNPENKVSNIWVSKI